METYLLTGDEKYKARAIKAMSWLSGTNSQSAMMYDSETGRTYDGIDDSGVNRNSGAESTIEALLTILEMKENGLI